MNFKFFKFSFRLSQISEASQIRGRAHERQALHRSGRNRRGSRKEVGVQRLRQGLRRSWTVSGLEEKQGSLHRLAQGPRRRQHQASQRLLPLPHRLVRRIPLTRDRKLSVSVSVSVQIRVSVDH